jgi:hypothetical protein
MSDPKVGTRNPYSREAYYDACTPPPAARLASAVDIVHGMLQETEVAKPERPLRFFIEYLERKEAELAQDQRDGLPRGDPPPGPKSLRTVALAVEAANELSSPHLHKPCSAFFETLRFHRDLATQVEARGLATLGDLVGLGEGELTSLVHAAAGAHASRLVSRLRSLHFTQVSAAGARAGNRRDFMSRRPRRRRPRCPRRSPPRRSSSSSATPPPSSTDMAGPATRLPTSGASPTR